MKHLSLILIILILSCCPLHPAYAFFDKDIRLLTMRDGLADNTIPCIYKDEDGFMWFGTDNGLSRYDGKTIQNFKPANTYVSIAAIVRLSDDFLGIVSDGYLYYFNRKRETFLPIHTESDTAIGVFNVLPADDSSFWGISGNETDTLSMGDTTRKGRRKNGCSGTHTKDLSVIGRKRRSLFFSVLS